MSSDIVTLQMKLQQAQQAQKMIVVVMIVEIIIIINLSAACIGGCKPQP
jgi:hypothetical protein